MSKCLTCCLVRCVDVLVNVGLGVVKAGLCVVMSRWAGLDV